jgi:hypothetical protein
LTFPTLAFEGIGAAAILDDEGVGLGSDPAAAVAHDVDVDVGVGTSSSLASSFDALPGTFFAGDGTVDPPATTAAVVSGVVVVADLAGATGACVGAGGVALTPITGVVFATGGTGLAAADEATAVAVTLAAAGVTGFPIAAMPPRIEAAGAATFLAGAGGAGEVTVAPLSSWGADGAGASDGLQSAGESSGAEKEVEAGPSPSTRSPATANESRLSSS